MRRADILSDIETLAALGTTHRQALARCLDAVLKFYATATDWTHYRDVGTIRTVDDYATGTVTVTNASTTVTGSGTTFTSAMVGRKFRVTGESAFYYIAAFVSTTELTLRDPYQGSTASGETFSIFQDEYRLAANLHKPLNLRQLQDGRVMLALSYQDLDQLNPSLEGLGDPLFWTVIGRRIDRYTTGTLALTANSRTLTGTSTNWTSVQGLGRGSRIAIDDTSEVFTVDTVDSDTQITTYELASVTDASSAYRIYLDNVVVQVSEGADAERNLYYRYQRLPQLMVRDFDEPDMPKEHHHMLVVGTLWYAHFLKGNQMAAAQAKEMFLEWLKGQKGQLGTMTPDLIHVKQSMDLEDQLLSGGPRWPSNIGVPLFL